MHSAATPKLQPHRPCGACGATSTSVLHHQRFVVPDGYPLPSEYNVVACGRCGFVFADAAASQADYDYFYCDWSKYDHFATATGSGVSPYDAKRLTATAADIARALPSRAATILDAGCATGGLLTALREQGFTAVAGLDPSPRCADACRERGFQAYVGSIGNAPAHMPKFDCVVFSHVLEHVFDIASFFTAARRVLAPGGYLYIETPDAARYSDYLYSPFQEFNTEHINHFSAKSLETAARHFGFQPILVEQKVLQTAEDMQYPAVFGLFRDSGLTTNEQVVTCGRALPSQIATYIARSTELLERINFHLTNQLVKSNQAILWGAGQLAMKLLSLPALQQVHIQALVDNNPVLRGKTFSGSPVVSPKDIADTTEPIVIATLLHADEIKANIRSLGLNNQIVSLLPDPVESTNGEARRR